MKAKGFQVVRAMPSVDNIQATISRSTCDLQTPVPFSGIPSCAIRLEKERGGTKVARFKVMIPALCHVMQQQVVALFLYFFCMGQSISPKSSSSLIVALETTTRQSASNLFIGFRARGVCRLTLAGWVG